MNHNQHLKVTLDLMNARMSDCENENREVMTNAEYRAWLTRYADAIDSARTLRLLLKTDKA